MKSLRLLPIVLVAVSALFLLKSIGLITQGGYLLSGTGLAQAQTQPAGDSGAMELTPAEAEAAARAAEALFAQDTPSESAGSENAMPAEGVAPQDASDGTEMAMANPQDSSGEGDSDPLAREAVSATEEAVLLRLRDRRAELDAREAEIDLRISLVEAAEARLNERIASLAEIEARVQALVDQQNAQGDEQFSSLVSMYENMKPTDAANVFNSLNVEVLLRLAINMNPRKMSPIMAKMQTDRARELTVRMASAEIEAAQTQMAANSAPQTNADLPQIIGQ